MITLKPLEANQVTFTITTEPEYPSREDFDSGATDPSDRAMDQASYDAVVERINRGDENAWCVVVVSASWRGRYARDTLGGCSLDDTYTKEAVAEEHGMQAEALKRLNEALAHTWQDMSELVSVTEPEDTRSMADLANEAIRVQDACNLSGVVHSFSKAIKRLRVLLREKGTESTNDINGHTISKAWASKIHSLAGSPDTHHGSLSKDHWGDLHDLATR